MAFTPGPGGGGGSIASSSDVSLDNVQYNQVLTYDTPSSKWQNNDPSTPTVANIPAGSTLSRIYTGTSWPARGTSRTDVVVQWIDFTSAAPTPPEALAEHDIVLIPDGV